MKTLLVISQRKMARTKEVHNNGLLRPSSTTLQSWRLQISTGKSLDEIGQLARVYEHTAKWRRSIG